jgi:protein-disulfide isomerase
VLGTEPQLKETYIKTGQVRLIFNPVLSHGSYSEQAHLAAECAAEQGQFWEIHDLLFENQDALWGDTRAVVEELAASLGLDIEQFNTCMDDQRYLDLIYSQDQLRQAAGIWGQPVFDIEGDRLFGAQPFEMFQEIIEAKL